MMKNSALLMITFAMFVFSPLGHAQDEEPSIDSAIEVARAGMQADKAVIVSRAMNDAVKLNRSTT